MGIMVRHLARADSPEKGRRGGEEDSERGRGEERREGGGKGAVGV